METDTEIEEQESPTPPPPAKKLSVPRISRQKPFDWFAGPPNPTIGEKALWIAVITQAMMDALARSRNSEAQYYKHEAIHWLTENSKDFIIVCHLAELDPDYVRKQAKKALASPRPWRAEPGKGKRYEERKSYRNRIKKTPVKNEILRGPWKKPTKGA